jgi:hypothetical protein
MKFQGSLLNSIFDLLNGLKEQRQIGSEDLKILLDFCHGSSRFCVRRADRCEVDARSS